MTIKIKIYLAKIKQTPRLYIALIWLLGTVSGVSYPLIYSELKELSKPTVWTYARAAERQPIKPDYVVLEKSSGEFSAYTMAEEENDSTPLVNASGGRPTVGSIACPIRFDFGTLIKVNGNIYTCDDRMAARYREKDIFDLFVPDKTEALQWGRKILSFEVLQPVDNSGLQ